ncbi:Protein DEHYDRATION-INDUCED 19 homolog 4 [Striga hermonthica]|uniref:Protein DEHYDRATION-INDUCED 19 homolog 4 n=1 Tax=Striga hermonthica TaxID=68872 RepID=A0A9N7RJE9_STRHE|nr:Protein DEHYDRATION-INDUCED 19 homolog 4 [Striga hermonthica]
MGDRFYDDLEIALSSYSLRSTNDYYNEEEGETEEGDYEGDEFNDLEIDEKCEELACPFCLEDFDVLGLCCHIDADHRMEVKPGICPVCATKVGINMASHVITQHESILKISSFFLGARSRSTIYILRKEMQEKYSSCIKETPSAGPSSNAASDSMLLSFVNSSQTTGKLQNIEARRTNNVSLAAKSSTDDHIEESKPPPSLPTDVDNERAKRCEFLQGLLLNAILDDI